MSTEYVLVIVTLKDELVSKAIVELKVWNKLSDEDKQIASNFSCSPEELPDYLQSDRLELYQEYLRSRNEFKFAYPDDCSLQKLPQSVQFVEIIDLTY